MKPSRPEAHSLNTPLSAEDVAALRAGDSVLLSGVVYSARDMAHKRMTDALQAGEELPFDLEGQVIYYMGPSPAPPGRPIGAAGPTTSARMDPYAPALYQAGIRATIGKGPRSAPVLRALRDCGAVYLAAVGGAGALLGRCIREAEVIAYAELGPEAVRRLGVEQFPAIVAADAHGGDVFRRGGAT
jgi:fumarate hydratase subunit beta